MTFKDREYETVLELHTLILVNEAMLTAYEKELTRKRMLRDVDVASCETKVNIQRNFVKELHALEKDLVDTIDKIAISLDDFEAQIFLNRFVLGLDREQTQRKMNISRTCYYKYTNIISEKLKDNKDFQMLSETLAI